MSEALASPPQLSVSLVVYDTALEQMRATLTGLADNAGSLVSQGWDVAITIVDNSGDARRNDALRTLIEAQPSGMHLHWQLLAQANRGFGAGHNCVVLATQSDYHLVLNPDAELPADLLLFCLGWMQEHSTAVAVAPRVIDSLGDQQYLCKRYPSVLVLLLRAVAPAAVQKLFAARLSHYECRDLCDSEQAVAVPLLSGSFLLLRTGPLFRIGGFDESYFLYFEDFDLSLRLAEFGELVYLPQRTLLHHGGNAAGKGWRHRGYFARAAWRFFRSHGWKWI